MMRVHCQNSTRREFLEVGSFALLAALSPPVMAAVPAAGGRLFSAMGISAPLADAASRKADGAEFLTASVGGFLVPDQPAAVFGKNLTQLSASPLPILACNGFIRPKELHCVGPEANHDAILSWADITFRRMKRVGGKFIIFGSAGARRVPDGWPREKAAAQFIALLKQLGPLAEARGIIVAVEQLRAEECNFINHISQGAVLIRAAGHQNIRLLADLYHMAVMGDTPDDLRAAMDVVVHVEIAEKAGRTAPGVNGDDFRPFFRVLRERGYHGAISIESKSTNEQIRSAFLEIAKQASES